MEHIGINASEKTIDFYSFSFRGPNDELQNEQLDIASGSSPSSDEISLLLQTPLTHSIIGWEASSCPNRQKPSSKCLTIIY